MNLIDRGLLILRERGIKFADAFVPPLMASFGCHVFNLVNREKQIFYHLRSLPDMRLHVLFTAPPGFSKSLFLKHMLEPGFGLCYVNNALMQLEPPYPPDPAFRFMGSCTEAGWTGSVTGSGANAVKDIGLAEKYKRGIAGMEEFVAITQIMHQEHSRHLEQVLNKSLFGGDVEKDLKGFSIQYHTDITMWAGNQVMNFDISGGLFRRLFQMLWIPRLRDAEELKDAIWDSDNLPPLTAQLATYRANLSNLVNRVQDIKSVEFDDSVRKLVRPAPHFEQLLYKNFALGYTLMSESDVPRDVKVHTTRELEYIIRLAMTWRKQLLADPPGAQVMNLIYDIGASGWVKWTDVREKNLLYSTSYYQTDNVLRRLIDQKRVKYNPTTSMVMIA